MSKRSVKSYIWDEVETLAPREMEKLQLDRLRAGIDRVSKTVPFYKNKLSETGVTADSIRSVEDLDRLPFTTKGDLRDNYPYGLVAVPMKDVIRVHASSGTTGKPTVVAYTRNDINLWSDLMARTLSHGGLSRRTRAGFYKLSRNVLMTHRARFQRICCRAIMTAEWNYEGYEGTEQ